VRAVVYTIGHSNHPIDVFVELLTRHGVQEVADVRSQPHSRFNPQYNRERLRASLGEAGIDYAFLGAELGARASDPECYVGDKVDYELLARSAPFRRGVERVAAAARERRVALLCAERDPLTCHRAILVCPHLQALGIDARHIREDGRIESGEAAVARLLAEEALGDGDLFASRAELVNEAHRRRGVRIAYARKPKAARDA
jgi:uncharacterized protein (DUF488 family)